MKTRKITYGGLRSGHGAYTGQIEADQSREMSRYNGTRAILPAWLTHFGCGAPTATSSSWSVDYVYVVPIAFMPDMMQCSSVDAYVSATGVGSSLTVALFQRPYGTSATLTKIPESQASLDCATATGIVTGNFTNAVRVGNSIIYVAWLFTTAAATMNCSGTYPADFIIPIRRLSSATMPTTIALGDLAGVSCTIPAIAYRSPGIEVL